VLFLEPKGIFRFPSRSALVPGVSRRMLGFNQKQVNEGVGNILKEKFGPR
jgi:hypothetical protein